MSSMAGMRTVGVVEEVGGYMSMLGRQLLLSLLLLSIDYGEPGQEEESQGEQNLALLSDQPSLARRPSRHDGGNNAV